MLKFTSALSKVITIIVGLMFLAGGLFFFLKYDPAEYDTPATGTIVEINEYYDTVGEDSQLMHDVYIDYKAGDEVFEHIPYFGYDSSMKVGDEVNFFYMSSDPSQIAGADKESTPYFGLAFAVIGLGVLVVTAVRIIRKKPV